MAAVERWWLTAHRLTVGNEVGAVDAPHIIGTREELPNCSSINHFYKS